MQMDSAAQSRVDDVRGNAIVCCRESSMPGLWGIPFDSARLLEASCSMDWDQVSPPSPKKPLPSGVSVSCNSGPHDRHSRLSGGRTVAVLTGCANNDPQPYLAKSSSSSVLRVSLKTPTTNLMVSRLTHKQRFVGKPECDRRCLPQIGCRSLTEQQQSRRLPYASYLALAEIEFEQPMCLHNHIRVSSRRIANTTMTENRNQRTMPCSSWFGNENASGRRQCRQFFHLI